MVFEWQYNEFKQIGTDYNNIEEVRIYDERMGTLRNIEAENKQIVEKILLSANDKVLEIGCGNANFSIYAAKICKEVTALDISKIMIEYAKGKAKKHNVSNIHFINAGFLTIDHSISDFDVAISGLALHHLPDFWKLIALKNIFNSLKPGGLFLLKDIVYSFEISNLENEVEKWVESAKDKNMKTSMQRHIRDEFSTTSWIMENLLITAGFHIQNKQYADSFFAEYVCVKN